MIWVLRENKTEKVRKWIIIFKIYDIIFECSTINKRKEEIN